MRLTKFCIALACCTLMACGPRVITPPPAVSSAPPDTASATPSADALLEAERAFAAAEIEWQSAIAVGRTLVARGVIRGATAAMVRDWNGRARAVIVRGKAVADAAGKARAAADLLGLSGQLDALTGRK